MYQLVSLTTAAGERITGMVVLEQLVAPLASQLAQHQIEAQIGFDQGHLGDAQPDMPAEQLAQHCLAGALEALRGMCARLLLLSLRCCACNCVPYRRMCSHKHN